MIVYSSCRVQNAGVSHFRGWASRTPVLWWTTLGEEKNTRKNRIWTENGKKGRGIEREREQKCIERM